MTTTIVSVLIVIFATFIGAFGSLLFKLGADKLQFKLKHIITNYILICGVILYGLSAIIFLIALKGGELTILYPITSFTYIWIIILSIKFLKEKMNTPKWWGIALIILGVSLIGIGA